MKSGVLVPVAVVLVCLPFACAAPSSDAPREYRQAPAFPVAPPRPAPRAPRAPGFNPAEDAPHRIGHPGYRRREYPKSPYKRVLPQNEKTKREDTIWAAEVPNGSTASFDAASLIPSFLPENPNAFDRFIVTSCAIALTYTYITAEAEDPGTLLNDERLYSHQQRQCMASMIYHACIQGFWEQNRGERKEAAKTGTLANPSLDNTLSRAAEVKRRECEGMLPLPDRAERITKIKVRRIKNYYATLKRG